MFSKKYISIICALFVATATIEAQVVTIDGAASGVRFQVDPLKNSSRTTNTSDDLVITTTGNVGIGTTTPRAKLEVSGGGLRIVDGNQQAGAFLVSDATGLGSWHDPDLIGRRVTWGAVQTAATAIPKTYVDVTSTPLNLKGGLWMIVGRADIVGTGNGTEERPYFVWLSIYEKTTSNGVSTTKSISEAGIPYMIRLGVYRKYYATPMVMGFVSIPSEGLAQKTREYYLYAKSPSSTYTNVKLTTDLSGAYFYAIKLQ